MPFYIPLGISNFNGESERDFFQFSYEIEDNDATKLTLQIRNGNTVWFEEIITDPNRLSQGEHIWQWDGFDTNGIYDSAKLTLGRTLNFYAVAEDNNGNVERSSTTFQANYNEVSWADVKINKNIKRIDVIIRVNFIDGGEIGTKKDCTKNLHAKRKMKCPWDEIPKSDIVKNNQNPIETRTSRTFEDLKKIAMEGVSIYWSRHQGNIGKGVTINNVIYEVFVHPVNETDPKISLDDIPLIFNTNNKKMRSGNPGKSHEDKNLDDDILDDLGVKDFFQRIVYNVGYLKKRWGWEYQYFGKEDSNFKYIAAHEIGHEILQAYRGTTCSWQHKGTSYYYPQKKKPLGKESFYEENFYMDFMENTKGETYPVSPNEIDVMKYYHGTKDYTRTIADEQDVLGILWLTKLELK